jgi:hypothetical protein
LTMSNKELDRAGVMSRLVERLSQEAAAETLGIGIRQVRRLLRAYEATGAASLVSKRCSRRSVGCPTRGYGNLREFARSVRQHAATGSSAPPRLRKMAKPELRRNPLAGRSAERKP